MLTASKEIELRRGDMDGLGHLNNRAYLELMFELRVEVLSALRTERDRFVVRRLEIDYEREVRAEHERVRVSLEAVELGASSVVFAQEVALLDGSIAARARVVLVAWDLAQRRSRRLTERERAALLCG